MESQSLTGLLVALQAMISAMAELEERVLSNPQFVEVILGCGTPCTITHNPGGSVPEFLLAARTAHNAELQVAIDGKCYSACVVFADWARPYACITKNASMHFHQGTQQVTNTRFIPSQSPDIDQWVREHGGYPETGFLVMRYPETRDFWPECADDPSR